MSPIQNGPVLWWSTRFNTMEILFLWVGLLLALFGIIVVKSATSDTAEAGGACRVDGEIIGYIANDDGPNAGNPASRTYTPVIAFLHPAGGVRIFQSEIGTNYFPYSIGQQVRVLARRDDPSRAQLDSNALLYFGLLFTAIGLGCCGLFFAIFSWSLFSIASSIVVTLLLLWKTFQQQDSVSKFAQAAGLLRGALAGQAVEDTHFDRSRLMSSNQISVDQRRLVRVSLIAATLMIVLGVGGVVGSIWWVPRRNSFIQHAVGAEGRVVELVQSQDSDSVTFAPLVEFKPVSSSTAVRFRHPVASSPPSFHVGDSVKVLYDPEDLSHAMLDQGWWNLAVPYASGVIGVVFCFLGILSLARVSKGGEWR